MKTSESRSFDGKIEISKKPFRFTKIHLENWRNFTQVDMETQRRVFLVGPNASGKSNLLDVFRFLYDIVSIGGGFQEAVRKRGGVSKLRCLAARGHPEIAIKFDIGDDENTSAWSYEIRFTQDNNRNPIIRQEIVKKVGIEILRRPDVNDGKDSKRLTQTYLEQINANAEFRDIADFFSSIRYLHIIPQLVREPNRIIKSEDLFGAYFGADFLERIARTPEKTRRSRLRRIAKALQGVIPQLADLDQIRDIVTGVPHLKGKYEHWRAKGAWQTEEQFSDGTLRLMGLLWAVMDGTGPILLEEPELSLHQGVIYHIPQMLARVQRRTRRQVLLSTHSSVMLEDKGISMDEVFVLKPNSEGTSVIRLDSIKNAVSLIKSGLNLADVVIPETEPENAYQLTLFGDMK
jgi:predicted ATPase